MHRTEQFFLQKIISQPYRFLSIIPLPPPKNLQFRTFRPFFVIIFRPSTRLCWGFSLSCPPAYRPGKKCSIGRIPTQKVAQNFSTKRRFSSVKHFKHPSNLHFSRSQACPLFPDVIPLLRKSPFGRISVRKVAQFFQRSGVFPY